MLFKGIIFVLIGLLFISRLIPKYLTYRETSQVYLLGANLEGTIGLLALIGVAVLGAIVLIIGIKNIYLTLTTKQEIK